MRRPTNHKMPDHLRLQLGIEHLMRLGPRGVAIFFTKLLEAYDVPPEGLLANLDTWREQISVSRFRRNGGDKFPPLPPSLRQ